MEIIAYRTTENEGKGPPFSLYFFTLLDSYSHLVSVPPRGSKSCLDELWRKGKFSSYGQQEGNGTGNGYVKVVGAEVASTWPLKELTWNRPRYDDFEYG
jgi:hypothetical protein